MARRPSNEKQQAHELIERLGPTQVSAIVGVLEAMLDPVARAIANAPEDDEEESGQERQAVSESKSWFKQHGSSGIPHDEVVAKFELAPEDSKTPRK